MSPLGAWVRYGYPISDEEISVAADRYAVAILQPWEIDAARQLKTLRPDMVVLQYRCLSSVRDYEPGPIHSSGVSSAEAEAHDAGLPEGDPGRWFALRPTGERIEWAGYPGHWQQRHWIQSYRDRWVANVVEALDGSPFDGVMADNDVFDDYYRLDLPLDDGTTIDDIRVSLDEFVPQVGADLNAIGKILVPNVAESRRDPGRWDRHGAFGGAFEECWLSWAAGVFLSPHDQLRQLEQVRPGGPELVIARIATDGSSGPEAHPSFRYGLAAWWISGGGRAGGFAATAHDAYSDSPWIEEMSWDLGRPMGKVRGRDGRRARTFERGWAAVHLGPEGSPPLRFRPPRAMVDAHGDPVRSLTLRPHEGAVLRRGDGDH